MSDIKREQIIIGVTGGIACGKSEAGRILGEMGFDVLDADVVARDLMGEGAPVFRTVVDRFGERVLASDGEISRPALSEIVFNDEAARRALNELTHPAVREAIAEWIDDRALGNRSAAVLIPLLFESGMETLNFDAIVCVSSAENEVVQRLKKRGLNREEAERRIRSQMPIAEKERRADFTIPNFGTVGELELATRKVVAAICER